MIPHDYNILMYNRQIEWNGKRGETIKFILYIELFTYNGIYRKNALHI